MNIIKRATLEAFWSRHPETEQASRAWFHTVRSADWTRMDDVMRTYPKAKALNGERVRFEVCGGNYRLVVAFKFTARIAFIKFIGTHAEYDQVDALTVDLH